MNVLKLALPTTAAFGAVALLFPAAPAVAFVTTGDSLDTTQRDFRLADTFDDVIANDNTVADPNFPGYTGAEMAVWKAYLEWGSTLHGDGNGDPTQPAGLGSGGANFDPSWQGNATSAGSTDDNVVSVIRSCGTGAFAFTEIPTSDGWRIRFCDEFVWSDGPNLATFATIDLQGVATHEFGHALGLDHSTPGTVMQPTSASGNDQRDLTADDIAGVQSIYGVASALKPVITNVTVNGTTITIDGTNFSAPAQNDIWFTSLNATSPGVDPIVKLVGVSAPGQTQIVATIPPTAGPGDVLVWNGNAGHDSLSNAFPADVVAGPSGPTITTVTPSTIPALIPGTDQTITITGTNLTPTTTVSVDGIALGGFPSPVSWVDSTQMTFDMPQVNQLGSIAVDVSNASGSDSTNVTVAFADPPAFQIGSGVEPVNLFSSLGADFTMAAEPGSLFFVYFSDVDTPSFFPGHVTMDIGAIFTRLWFLGVWVVDPTKAWTKVTLPFSGIPSLTTLYLQAVEVPLVPILPVDASNVQEVQIIW